MLLFCIKTLYCHHKHWLHHTATWSLGVVVLLSNRKIQPSDRKNTLVATIILWFVNVIGNTDSMSVLFSWNDGSCVDIVGNDWLYVTLVSALFCHYFLHLRKSKKVDHRWIQLCKPVTRGVYAHVHNNYKTAFTFCSFISAYISGLLQPIHIWQGEGSKRRNHNNLAHNPGFTSVEAGRRHTWNRLEPCRVAQCPPDFQLRTE